MVIKDIRYRNEAERCALVEAAAHVFAASLRAFPGGYDHKDRRANAKLDLEKFLEDF